MNDLEAIAQRFDRLGYAADARRIRRAHSEAVEAAMRGLERALKDDRLTPACRAVLGDFIFNNRSYQR